MSDRVQRVVVDLNQQLLDTLDTLRSLVGERIAVSASMATRLGMIRVDPSAMRRAILGLARKADVTMPSRGCLLLETRNVRFASRMDCDGGALPPGEYVCLSISDTSAAPWSNDPATPYDFRLELRLAPVFAFAKRNGGTATVRSETDRGITVSVYLPHVSTEAPSLKDETGELRGQFPRQRWQGLPNFTQTACVSPPFRFPRGSFGLPPAPVAGRWFCPQRPAPTLFSRTDAT
jgi:hypothetical protein